MWYRSGIYLDVVRKIAKLSVRIAIVGVSAEIRTQSSLEYESEVSSFQLACCVEI